MKFLIQSDDKDNVLHEFSFVLIDAIKYNNWYRNEQVFSYKLTFEKTYPNCIPIGSVEFVNKYLLDHHNIINPPINIPDELFNEQYLKRKCWKFKKENIPQGSYFVKSLDVAKGFTEVVENDHSIIPEGNYLVSEIIDIESEWRCFIYKNKLVGLQNYLGDFTIFPNIDTVRSMIHEYKNSPIAYTLDVGVSGRGTYVIEVHRFTSVGLYGMSDYKILPHMFRDAFLEIIK